MCWLASLAISSALGLSSCALFNQNPPLPKRGTVETASTPRAADEFAEVVERAEVFYVAADQVRWATHPEPGWGLIEALRRKGAFALGWTAISSDQQRILDAPPANHRLSADPLSAIRFIGSTPEREHGRELMEQTRGRGVTHLALRCPAELAEKLRRGEFLSAPEREVLPTGYAQSVENNYAVGSDGTERAAVLNSQWVAERIVDRLRSHASEKVLVFVAREELENATHSVPALVAQKIGVRQLVLETKLPVESHARLLTSN